MGTVIILVLALALPAAAAAAPSLSYVQATVAATDPARTTLSFVDPSGRTRSHPVTPSVAARLSRLRPGDAVIVVLGEDRVQDVKVSRLAEAASPEPSAAADAPPWLAPVQTLRPTWPNPYSRFYRGPRPAPPRRPNR